VWIKVNDNIIFQRFLKPRSEEIEEAAKIGFNATMQFLLQYEQIKKQLAAEDLKGTGIY